MASWRFDISTSFASSGSEPASRRQRSSGGEGVTPADPFTLPLPVSVTVTVSPPAVIRVTPLVNVWTPASVPVKL